MASRAPSSQSLLRTARIRLIPLADEHLDFEVALDADPEVVRYIGNGKPRRRIDVEERHRGRLAVAQTVPGLGFWVGFVGDDFVGWWILEPPSRRDQGPVEGQAELGFRLVHRFWRQGLAKEGARELVRYGFEQMGLRRIFAETMAVNKASRATMASVGLSYEKTVHLDFEDTIPGFELGEVVYATTKNEWLAAQSPAS